MPRFSKKAILEELTRLYPDAGPELNFTNPYETLVAVMLSAQCRDERVNMVTEKLFALAPDAKSMSQLAQEEIEKIIHPCGLSQSKSGNLLNSARIIVEKFNGSVPCKMDDLTSLPGIGRKSANVILGNAFNIPGFPVDTHVKRVLNRLGVVKSDSPEKIEKIITDLIAPAYWTNFSHLLIQHGRQVCHSRKPVCEKCVLNKLCACKKDSL